MRFLLLGPVTALHDGVPVDLGRRQERLLLGFLLLEPSRAIPLPRLVDLLWPDTPPAGARKAVQTYLARLRAHLRPTGPAIVSDGGGYRIDAVPGDVDAHEFLGLLDRARAAAGDDRAALLDRALALWRGPVLGDACPARVRERVGTRLAQARLAALEERAGDHLARGDHDAAIALLAGPALDRSVPEPLVALLMRAYTASGRRAEALAVYDRARQLLWQELRIHPGQSLVDERNRARWGSGRAAAPPVAPPAARPDAPPAAAQRPSAPHELPAAPIGFVGRDRELRRLLDVLGAAGPRDRPTVVALHGPGGVGKSALAVAAARHLADRFPDGQVYIDLCGSTPGVPSLTALEAAGQALRSLGVPAADIPRTAAEATARLRSRLAGTRLLLLLDNADDPAVPRALMPAAAGCALLVTSRSRHTTVDSDLDVEVPALSPADARSLLFRHAGRVSNSRAVDRVAELCEFLPLALRVAAARLADRTGVGFAEFAARLADQRQRLDELDVQGLAVRSSIGVSYDALRSGDNPLDRRAGDVFVRLGILPAAEFSAEYVSALLGSPDLPAARQALARLVDVHLVGPAGTRYGLHDLVRLFAIERAPADLPAGDREAAVDRALAHYLTTGVRVARLLTPGREPSGAAYRSRPDAPADSLDTGAAAVAWLEREVPTLLALAERVSTPAQPPHRALFALGIVRALSRPLLKRGEWVAVHQLARRAVVGADRQPDPIDRADALRLLGHSEIHLNDEAAAGHLTLALATVRAAGDAGRQIGTLTDLGIVATRRGEYAVALDYMLEALELARRCGERQLTGVTLLNLSSVYASLTDWKQSQLALEESLAIRRELADLAGLAIVLPALGSAHFLQGHLDEAMVAFTEGLDVCEQVGNTIDGWMAAFGRGLTRLARGDCVRGLHDARIAWAGREGRPHETAATFRLVALVLRQAGHPRIADAWDARADAAYAELTGPVEEQIELMLRRVT